MANTAMAVYMNMAVYLNTPMYLGRVQLYPRAAEYTARTHGRVPGRVQPPEC